ncbi:MAG TPA: hypothetical protein VFI74_02550 [Candidatus Saccharimonadales bacterium]|nr:hypothetical protein [Candidatus Saccharimonadales bacterium]
MSAERTPEEAALSNELHILGDAIGIDRPAVAEDIDLVYIQAEVARRRTLRGKLGHLLARVGDVLQKQ